jgi:SNF2 family DNA or RNA helicase
MRIDYKDDSILTFESPKQIEGQLSFWGFLKEDSSFVLRDKRDIEVALEKLLDFLDGEEVSYVLTPQAEKLRSARQQTTQDFSARKEVLQQFKDGDFDKAMYQEFLGFLEANVPRQLKEHQKKSAYHMYLSRNAANFSVPGSGKTSVVLSVYEKLRSEGVVNTLFVVGPPASFGPWRNEFKATLGRVPEHRVLAGGDRHSRSIEYFPDKHTKAELYLTTFQTILKDQDEVIKFLDSMHVNAFVVVDEAHYMKRLNGNWSNALLRLSSFAVVRCVLTGTPIPRSYTDVFNLFEFLWPGRNPISESARFRIQEHEREKEYEKIKPILDEAIGPLFYRVRKKDLNLMPPVFHPSVKIKMNRYERLIYDTIENKIRDKEAAEDFHDFDIVMRLRRGRLIRLRQAVSYIKLLENVLDDYNEVLIDPLSDIGKYIHTYDKLERPGKLEYLLKLVEDLKGKNEKVVIWSNFLGTIELIRSTLVQNGFPAKVITGATPVEQSSVSDEETRESIRNEFVDPNSGLDILIANPAACAESISLHTTCHNAVYYDLSYNCAQYLQSLDRIHRVGGSETVVANYFFLQYEDSIDGDVKDSLDRKAQNMYAVIDQDSIIYSVDTTEDDELAAYERILSRKS